MYLELLMNMKIKYNRSLLKRLYFDITYFVVFCVFISHKYIKSSDFV